MRPIRPTNSALQPTVGQTSNLGESEVGLYGLEAASPADANRIEGVLRGIWARNESLRRARVHRKGKVLVVVWNDGVSPSCEAETSGG